MDTQINVDVLSIVATILGIAYAFFKGTEIYDKILALRFKKSIEAIEAGVEEVYRTYTTEIKFASADGKLTTEEQKIARDKAIEAAKKYAQLKGVDLIKVIGEDFLNLWIERSLKKIKGETK